MGVSVENATNTVYRLDHLRRTPRAGVRFVSFEPLLGPLAELNLDGIDWVIVGGESGPGARPMDKRLGDSSFETSASPQECRSSSSNGAGTNKKKAGRLLDGRTWDELPRVSTESRLGL